MLENNMTKIFFLFSAALFICFSPLAQGGETLIGSGSMICETYTQSDNAVKLASENWVLGFLSSVNMRSKNLDLLLSIDAVSVIAAVENYCDLHTGDKIADAAIFVLRQLVGSADGNCSHPEGSHSGSRGLNRCENPASIENNNEPTGWSMTIPSVE